MENSIQETLNNSNTGFFISCPTRPPFTGVSLSLSLSFNPQAGCSDSAGLSSTHFRNRITERSLISPSKQNISVTYLEKKAAPIRPENRFPTFIPTKNKERDSFRLSSLAAAKMVALYTGIVAATNMAFNINSQGDQFLSSTKALITVTAAASS